jgi:hypothetical protein
LLALTKDAENSSFNCRFEQGSALPKKEKQMKPFTQEDVKKMIRGSRRINEMKAEIQLVFGFLINDCRAEAYEQVQQNKGRPTPLRLGIPHVGNQTVVHELFAGELTSGRVLRFAVLPHQEFGIVLTAPSYDLMLMQTTHKGKQNHDLNHLDRQTILEVHLVLTEVVNKFKETFGKNLEDEIRLFMIAADR